MHIDYARCSQSCSHAVMQLGPAVAGLAVELLTVLQQGSDLQGVFIPACSALCYCLGERSPNARPASRSGVLSAAHDITQDDGDR